MDSTTRFLLGSVVGAAFGYLLSQRHLKRVLQELQPASLAQKAMNEQQVTSTAPVGAPSGVTVAQTAAAVQEVPVQEVPVRPAPVQQVPVREAPVQEAPFEQAPEQAPLDLRPVPETPAQETTRLREEWQIGLDQKVVTQAAEWQASPEQVVVPETPTEEVFEWPGVEVPEAEVAAEVSPIQVEPLTPLQWEPVPSAGASEASLSVVSDISAAPEIGEEAPPEPAWEPIPPAEVFTGPKFAPYKPSEESVSPDGKDTWTPEAVTMVQEKPSWDVAAWELTVAETPVVETPSADEAPVVEEPMVELSVEEIPTVEVPVSATPVVELQVVEAEPEAVVEAEPEAVVEAEPAERKSVAEAAPPVSEGPVVELPVSETPTTSRLPADDLKARIEETRRRIRQELEQPFFVGDLERSTHDDWTITPAVAPVEAIDEAVVPGPALEVPLSPAAGLTGPGPETVAVPEEPVDYETVRDRIEAARSRLKAKAFDAMMMGEAALLGRDPEGASQRRKIIPAVDSEVNESIENVLREEEA